MRWMMVLLAAVAAGCASLDHAGMAEYQVRPFVDGAGQAHCCEISVKNGKEMASLDAVIVKDGERYTVVLQERGVQAFAGHAIAAGAAKTVVDAAAKAAAGAATGAVLAPLAPVLVK
jgi:hypothetical protein